MVKNKSVRSWIQEMNSLLSPEDIVWIDGSESQVALLRNIACNTKELIELNQDILPGCYLHRSDESDVCRVEDRTFICCKEKLNAGTTNNWWNPKDAKQKLLSLAKDSYKGRIMYVIPFSMADPNSPFHKLGVEITDSIYVALSMATMARVNKQVSKKFNASKEEWTKCIHCSCNCDPNERYICHFPEENTVISVNSSYGGNALLGKKCLALRLASHMGKNEGWLAEHMAIFGIKAPYNDEVKYICAALPSGCGKTDLAMMDICDQFKKKGYSIECIGDDIAWMRIGEDGRLWAINPENGVFGACAGINEKNNKNVLELAKKNTIFTNVIFDSDNKTVWWEGLNDAPPSNGIDWKGNKWNSDSGVIGAQKNSRFAAPLTNCPCLSEESTNVNGVPITAIILGVKRRHLTPLVVEAPSWVHGVFLGASMSSETTVASSGKVGVLRHDPFGMLPFCGYNMSDYFDHWIEMGKKLGKHAPKIFGVNWYRVDDDGKYIWPGFGENIRVLDWILKRCNDQLDVNSEPIGYTPKNGDIDVSGLSISKEEMSKITSIDPELWSQEEKEIDNFLKSCEKTLQDFNIR